MRIEVVGEGTISQQARTYAEYRVFAALTQFSEADKVRTRSLLSSSGWLAHCLIGGMTGFATVANSMGRTQVYRVRRRSRTINAY